MSLLHSFLVGYDFNLPLEDALNDRSLSADRRVLASVSMRQGLDEGYFSVQQLLEAMRELETDARLRIPSSRSIGRAQIDTILVADGDDYQRRLYWILAERPITDAVSDLVWLAELLRGRAQMFSALVDAGARMPPMPGA